MMSVTPRGWVLELRPIEHERNGPTRYREVLLTPWDHTS